MTRCGKWGKGASGSQRQPGAAGWLAISLMAMLITASSAMARDAAFINPNASGGGSNDDAIKIDPKGDIDVGDSPLSVARHTDVFFENQSDSPVKIEKIAVNGDGNVATEIVSDDCSKQGTIQPSTRCSVEVALTPSSPGSWTAEVIMTHDGAGRIARAKISGKTSGVASTEKKDNGLAFNSKEASPVNFGDVDIDSGGKIVRSALMVNDSPEPITLYSIDVIEASNGLQRLDQGCAVDMELKPGESCPVTLVWSPSDPGQISTDLIIRHSGRLGFAVIPIRGIAHGDAKAKPSGGGEDTTAAASSSGHNASSSGRDIPPPPGASELEKAAGDKIPSVTDSSLKVPASAEEFTGKLYLIGTVGSRAIILKPDGKTVIANAGDDLDIGAKAAKLILVSSKSVDLMIDGKKKTLKLDSAPELIEKATLKAKTGSKDKDKKDIGTETVPTSTPPPASGGGVIGGPAGSGVPK